MSVEVEIKLKIEDPEQLIEKLEGLGFIKGEQLLESDTYFTSENHDFVNCGFGRFGMLTQMKYLQSLLIRERSWMIVPWQGKNWNWRSQMRKLEKHFFSGLDSIRCRCWKKSVGISGEMR